MIKPTNAILLIFPFGYHIQRQSISRRASPASTTDTFNGLIFLQLRLWHSTYTGGVEICLLGLYASQAAQLYSHFKLAFVHADITHRSETYLLVALLLPFRDQVTVCIAILNQPFIELPRYCFFVVI